MPEALPLYLGIPFAGILLSIAIFPMVKPHWWVRNLNLVSAFWALAFAVPYVVTVGWPESRQTLFNVLSHDYLPFMILLISLYVVSGGIFVRGNLKASPWINTALLAIGTVLASAIGSIAASVIVIRPMLRTNAWRKHKAHIVVFCIFLVCNIGGVLTPVGQPPLFLGFLKGVPFFWTLHLWPIFAVACAVLFPIFFAIDAYSLSKETANTQATAATAVTVDGLHNFAFLAAIVGVIMLSGAWRVHPFFYDAATDTAKSLRLWPDTFVLEIPWINIVRDAAIAILAAASWFSTNEEFRLENNFSWAPLAEVGYLFAGIFITIVPVISILELRGASLGLDTPARYFWASGILSSFLDNAPTYLTFLSAAGGYFKMHADLLGTAPVLTSLGTISAKFLMAISSGSVFMGANTYIGNAPNFLVKSIAEESGYPVPSFFGYMLWSGCILLPLFALITLIFF